MEKDNPQVKPIEWQKSIATYTLPDVPSTVTQMDDDSNAAVVNNALLSFVAGMSSLNKEYTRKSYLLASSYVSDVLNISRGSEAWYDAFIKVMTSLGWLPVRSGFKRESRSKTALTVEMAALNMLSVLVASTAAWSGSLVAALPKLAAQAFEALKRHQVPLELFKRGIHTEQGGDFGLASCAENDGEVMMVLVTFSSQTAQKEVGVPFIEWDSSSMEVFSGRTCLVLNGATVDEGVINLLRERVGDKVLKAIAKYKI